MFLAKDYYTGAHPKVLKKLSKINYEINLPYGEDRYTQKVQEIIRKRINNPLSEVFLLTGGTQTNLALIAHALKNKYEAVISMESGHIARFETGAIEALGHKIIEIKDENNGKISVSSLQEVYSDHLVYPHKVLPKLVYISQPTQAGLLYTRQEIKELYECCQTNDLYFFIDGARMAVALNSLTTDFNEEDLGKYCDAFYYGGAKSGALFGEALVINNPEIAKNFRYTLKQRGGLLNKGFILGAQFEALFEDELYNEIGKHINEMGYYLVEELRKINIEFSYEFETNHIYPIFKKSIYNQFKDSFPVMVEKEDQDQVYVTLVTSWETTKSEIDSFVNYLQDIMK